LPGLARGLVLYSILLLGSSVSSTSLASLTGLA
jgi:hypothetical protein